jgi:hypothetical protein
MVRQDWWLVIQQRRVFAMNLTGFWQLAGLLVFALAGVAPAEAQQWARKMFTGETVHDFGIVAADSDAVHRFELQNIYEEDIHIASVSSSCHCTIASLEKQTLKTWDKSAIVARFNTSAFRGQKQATLTVRIDRPYYAEVQLIVRGNIRGNVAFEPGSVQFGDVKQGAKAEQKISVVHRGNPSWRITDVKTTFDMNQIKVGLTERYRQNGQVNYDMIVQLQDNVPAGYVQGELFIETNEGRQFRYPLAFHGRVVPSLELSPRILTLGPISPGEVVERKILLKADTPFRVTSIECSDDCLKIEAPGEPRKLHMMTVRYTAGDTPGQHQHSAEIQTDLGEAVTVFKTIATVESP